MVPDPDKREARHFEPPPWEKQRFEELARQRAETEEAAEEETRGQPEPRVEAPAAEEQEDARAPESDDGPDTTTGVEPGAGDVDVMLDALRAEEPKALEDAWKLGVAASVVVVTIGLMLVVWGAVAMARAGSAGAAGVMGSAIMSVMGALFAALGVWLGVRSLRQRGVL